MAVPELGAVLEGDDGLVTVGAVVACLGHGPGGDREDRRPARGGEVLARVAVDPEVGAVPEVVGHPEAARGERVLPGVLRDHLGVLLGAGGERRQGRVAGLGLCLRRGLELGVGGVLEGLALGVAADRTLATAEGVAGADAAGRIEHAGLGAELVEVVARELGGGLAHGGADGGQRERGCADEARRRRQARDQTLAAAGVAAGVSAGCLDSVPLDLPGRPLGGLLAASRRLDRTPATRSEVCHRRGWWYGGCGLEVPGRPRPRALSVDPARGRTPLGTVVRHE